MTYIAEGQIEARAAELWRRYSLAPAFDLERLLDDLGLGLVWEEVDDADGGKVLGQLIPQQRLVVLNERHLAELEAKGGRLGRFTIAHEIGHAILHAESLGAVDFFDDERVWCRDKSEHPIERQAEMFAGALLIPRDVLRSALPTESLRGWGPVYRLADRFQVNVTPMKIRLERLGWMHLDGTDTPQPGPAPPPGQPSLFETAG